MRMCGGQKSALGVVPLGPPSLFLETGSVSGTWGAPFRLGLLSREPLASPWLCLQHVLIGSCYHSKLSVQVQSTEVRLRFTRLTHYQLSYCLSPIFLVFGPSSEAAIALKIGTSFHFVRVFNLFYVYLL